MKGYFYLKNTQIHLLNKREPDLKKRRNLNKQLKAFFFSQPLNLFEGEKWLLAETSFAATSFVFIINHENNSSSITIPGYWTSTGGAETIAEVQNLLSSKSEDDFELHVEKVRRRGNLILLEDNETKLSELGSH